MRSTPGSDHVREGGVTEPIVEQATLAWLETFIYKVEHSSNIVMGELGHAQCVEAVL